MAATMYTRYILVFSRISDVIVRTDEGHDVLSKADLAVAGEVETVSFVEDHVLAHVAFGNIVIQVDFPDVVFVSVAHEEYVLFGSVFGKALSGANGIQHTVGFGQFMESGFRYFPQDEYSGGAQFGDIDADFGLYDVLGKALRQFRGEFFYG